MGLLQAHVSDIRLQAVYLAGCNSDSLAETEIIPFSGVSKSGAGIIMDAGGAGGFGHWLCACGVELQPLSAIRDISTKALVFRFGICQLLGVFDIDSGYGLALGFYLV